MKQLSIWLTALMLFGSMTASASYYIVGTIAENGWDPNKATLMVNNEITYTLAPGDNQFKVLTTLGSWDNQLNYNDIDWSRTTAICEDEANDHNVIIVLNKTSYVHISIVNGKICVTATPVSISNGNYVITYTASSKLEETTYEYDSGLHVNAFNVSISSHTYSGGTGTITFSGEVTSIGECAFYNCSGLTSITIPNSVTSIGFGAFSNCSALTSFTIPNSVTSIGDCAFIDCSALTSITIPNSVTSIGGRAFYNCSALTSITIPNSVPSIGYCAFYNCSSLTSITIGNSVTSIGSDAFYGCSSLTAVTIPNSVRSIGEWAFYNCSALTSITIGNRVTSIGEWAFYNCSALTSITIPNSVTSIGEDAFYNCSALTSVTIPNSVTSIGGYAFSGCSALTSIVVESGNTKYDSRNNGNAIIETATNTLIAGCQNTIIPNSVTSIGTGAFSDCSALTSITIPNSVTSIGGAAFYGCSGLTSITIPEGVTGIGGEAFAECTKLRNIACYAPEPPMIEENTFSNYNINLNVPCDYLDEYKYHAVWGLFKYIQCIDDLQGFESTTKERTTQKLLRNGQVLILRDDKTYNVQGVRVEK